MNTRASQAFLQWIPVLLIFAACGSGSGSGDTTLETAEDAVIDDTAVLQDPGADNALPDKVSSGCTTNCGEMVPVPAGSFWMGCNAKVANQCEDDEKPNHEVDVPAFDVDLTEVTVEAYGRCMVDGACTPHNPSSTACHFGVAGQENHPINCVNRNQAAAFCQWAGKRLCSEAEWEMAALGTDGRIYPWGDEPATCQYTVIDEGGFGCATDSAWPVGSKPEGASPCGALDMAGNLWEWVSDAYHTSYSGAPVDGSSWDEAEPESWVARGGAYSDGADQQRGANRNPFGFQTEGYYLGIRCCR